MNFEFLQDAFLKRQYKRHSGKYKVIQCDRRNCQNLILPIKDPKQKYCSVSCRERAEKLRHYHKTKYNKRIVLVAWELDLVKNLRPLHSIKGIYFLYRQGELVYIGKSYDVPMRVWTHRKAPLFEWDDVKYFKYSGNDISRLEARLISYYKPVENLKIKGVPAKTRISTKI